MSEIKGEQQKKEDVNYLPNAILYLKSLNCF